jgi:hypothetical protein
MAWLARDRPELVPRYQQLYRRGAYVPAEYRTWLSARVAPLLAEHGLDRRSGGNARKVGEADGATGLPGDPAGSFPTGSLPTGGLPGVRAKGELPPPTASDAPAPVVEQLSLI